MDVAPAAVEVAVEVGAVVEAACVQQYAAAAAWVQQRAACVCAAAGGGGRGNDPDGWQAASVRVAVGRGSSVRATACSGGSVCAAAGGSGRQHLQWDIVMAAASRRHNCNGQWRWRQCKGRQDGRKIGMNNNYGGGQMWVKAGVGGHSG